MGEINLMIRTADKTRKAEVTLSTESTVADVIQGAVDNWALPKDTDYTIVNTTNSRVLSPTATLEMADVKGGDLLEIQPVLVAG